MTFVSNWNIHASQLHGYPFGLLMFCAVPFCVERVWLVQLLVHRGVFL